jgi:hypothetical protein
MGEPAVLGIFRVYGQTVLDRPLMNSVDVHIYITFTVFDAIWLTTDVNLDVSSIKMDTA